MVKPPAALTSDVFTAEQVMRITGISRRRLAYWVDQEVISAEVDAAKGRGRVRLFSFRNLVEIRVALWLRDVVSLQLIRKVIARLQRQDSLKSPLARTSFAVFEIGGRRPRFEVALRGPNGEWEIGASGQKIMELELPLRRFDDEVRSAAVADRRKRRRVGQVEKRRGALGSATVLAGTRVPTKAILALHNAGYSRARILANYPGLESADVDAALSAERRKRPASGRARSA